VFQIIDHFRTSTLWILNRADSPAGRIGTSCDQRVRSQSYARQLRFCLRERYEVKDKIVSVKKLHCLSPRANYTDRATAVCRWSECQIFADSECHVVSVTDPYGRILGFLDRSRYFSINSSSVVLMRLSGPRSRPTTSFSGIAGNRTRASGSVVKNSDH
jgi:hypothetical protein